MAESLLSMQWTKLLIKGTCALLLSAGLSAAAAAPDAGSPTAQAPSAAPLSPAAKAKPAPAAAEKKPAPIKPVEALLFTQLAGRHQVLGRVDANGDCKAYLGKPGEGWIAYADPKISGDDYQAVSSADGSQIALLSSRNGAINLWLISADAREWKMLTDDDGGILEPSEATERVLDFAPDGKHLALIRRGALWVIALNGDQPRTLTQHRGVRALAWSPDSQWLAYLIGSSVHKVDVAGSPDLLLSHGLADEGDLAWHPDAKQELIYFLGGGLRKVDSRSRVKLLVPSFSRPNDLAVLPGGRQVALLVPGANGHSEACLATLGEKNLTVAQVTQEGAEGVLASSDPKMLYFLRDGVAWRCDLNGRKARPLGSVKMGAVRVGMLPPLKGVCP